MISIVRYKSSSNRISKILRQSIFNALRVNFFASKAFLWASRQRYQNRKRRYNLHSMLLSYLLLHFFIRRVLFIESIMSSLAKIYEECLVTFKTWSHKVFTSQQLAIANFNFSLNDIYDDEIECSTCDLALHEAWSLKNESIVKHLRESSWCLSTLKAQKQISTSKLTTKEAIETSKLEIIVVNINFFDSIMQLNLLEFHFYNFSVNFLKKLDDTTFKYIKVNLLIVLFKCLRDSIYAWFKTQTFTLLHSFKVTLVNAFSSSTSFEAFTTSFDSILSNFSSQYHTCSQCFAKFSFLSRLLQHAQKNNCFKVTCKHCEKIFILNNKFHEHVRLRHSQKASTKSICSLLVASRFVNFATFVVNSFESKALFKASQLTILSSKTSHLLILQTFSTSFFTFSHTSSLRHQQINHVTNRTSQKLYMTIDDLYTKFHEKSFKKSMNIIQKKMLSSMLDQINIIDYFSFICRIALNTSIKLKALKYELFTSTSIASILSINQRSRSSQAQNLKQNSNVSNSISLQSITLFSTLRVNQSIKDLKDSITSSRIELICVLIRATITQLTSLFNNSLKQDISPLLTSSY